MRSSPRAPVMKQALSDYSTAIGFVHGEASEEEEEEVEDQDEKRWRNKLVKKKEEGERAEAQYKQTPCSLVPGPGLAGGAAGVRYGD